MKFVKNPKAKKYGNKYKCSIEMERKDQFVLAYALVANSLRARPSLKEMKERGYFYEYETKRVQKKVKGELKTVREEKVVKTDLRMDKVKLYFSTQDLLHKAALKKYPELMKEVVEEYVYIPKKMKELKGRLSLKGKNKVDRLILTCAVGNAPIHKGMVSSIKNYIETMKKMGSNAVSVVFSADNKFEAIDNFFYNDEDFMVLFEDLKVNSNLYLNNIKMNPRQTNPLTGLEKFALTHDSSIVVGAPKIGWEPVCSVEGNQKIKACTGAITTPNYNSHKYGKYRTDTLAENSHELGFIIVELDRADKFHFRPIEVNNDGSFIDQGILFTPCVKSKRNKDGELVFDKKTLPKKIKDRIKYIPAHTASLGDLHADHLDPVIEKLTHQQIDFLEAKDVILHDSIDFATISHHSDNDATEKQALDMIGHKDVGEELAFTSNAINKITNRPSVQSVKEAFSNHDDFLARCLSAGRHIKDDRNGFVLSRLYPYAVLYKAKMHMECKSATNLNPSKVKKFGKREATKLLEKRFGKHFTQHVIRTNPDLLECKHPALVALEMFGLQSNRKDKKVEFLGPEDFVKVKNIYVNFHGNFWGKGPNALKNILKSIMGHTHKGMKTPGLKQYYNGVMKTKATYAAGGLPNWTATHSFIYPTGQVQQINMTNGKWRKEDGVYNKLKKMAA